MTEPWTALIAGPTASGKSALAAALAQASGGVVVNADSMQIYRGIEIVSAQPSEGERAAAPHRLYGALDADDVCSAGRWAGLARAEIAAAHEAGRPAVVVGGTGLYFEALSEGLAATPEIPEPVRAGVREEVARIGPAAAHAALAARDPETARLIRPSDPQRIARALEVLEASGRPLAEWRRRAPRTPKLAGPIRRLALAPKRDWLAERIEARLHAMIAEGALAEAEAMAARKLAPDRPAMKALGLRELIAHLDGRMSLEAAISEASAATRRYAKRQRSWARSRMGEWPRLDPADQGARARFLDFFME